MYLDCHSYFSLRYGTMSPETLAGYAKRMGVTELVLADVNNTSGCFPFVHQCRQAGIKPILGVEFRRDNRFLFIGIALNWEGFRELNDLLTECSLESKPLPDIPPAMPNPLLFTSLAKSRSPSPSSQTMNF